MAVDRDSISSGALQQLTHLYAYTVQLLQMKAYTHIACELLISTRPSGKQTKAQRTTLNLYSQHIPGCCTYAFFMLTHLAQFTSGACGVPFMGTGRT